MSKLKMPLCKLRKRQKGVDMNDDDLAAGEILVDESDNELRLDKPVADLREAEGQLNREGTTPSGKTSGGGEWNEGLDWTSSGEADGRNVTSVGGAVFKTISDTSMNDMNIEVVSNMDGMITDDMIEDDDEVIINMDDDIKYNETLISLISKMRTRSINIESIRSMTLTLDNLSNDLTTFQTYCTNRLNDLLKDNNLSRKCIEIVAPLCSSNKLIECDSLNNLLLTTTTSSSDDCLIDNNELRLEDDNKNKKENDYPTLPTGIKFIDDINNLLDLWNDNKLLQFNLYKLFNLSALLKLLGDPICVDIINNLGSKKLLSLPDEKKWIQILQEFNTKTTTTNNTSYNILPFIPNKNFKSYCNTKLINLPKIELNTSQNYTFKLYWTYTNNWLNKFYGLSIKTNYKFLEPTKKWFVNLEHQSQQLLLKLSKSLCSTQ